MKKKIKIEDESLSKDLEEKYSEIEILKDQILLLNHQMASIGIEACSSHKVSPRKYYAAKSIDDDVWYLIYGGDPQGESQEG